MAHAELEAAYLKKYIEQGLGRKEILIKMDDLTVDEILEDVNEGKGSTLYRTIVPINIEKDKGKTHSKLYSEIYRHAEDKSDINRNMLATIFARDPKKFNQDHEDINKLSKNNIAWPKNYIPFKHIIKKPPPPKTKEEIHIETLKEKHHLIMTYLPNEEVENMI